MTDKVKPHPLCKKCNPSDDSHLDQPSAEKIKLIASVLDLKGSVDKEPQEFLLDAVLHLTLQHFNDHISKKVAAAREKEDV